MDALLGVSDKIDTDGVDDLLGASDEVDTVGVDDFLGAVNTTGMDDFLGGGAGGFFPEILGIVIDA